MLNVHRNAPRIAVWCAQAGENTPTHTTLAGPTDRGLNATETPLAGPRAKWLSPHTLAQRWGVSRKTVLRLVRSGDLPVHRLNARVYRIAEADAEAYARKRYGHLSELRTKREACALPALESNLIMDT